FVCTEIDPLGQVDAGFAGVAAEHQCRLVDRVDRRGVAGTVRPGDLLPMTVDEAAVHALLRDVDRLRAEIADQLCQTPEALAVGGDLGRHARREIGLEGRRLPLRTGRDRYFVMDQLVLPRLPPAAHGNLEPLQCAARCDIVLDLPPAA